MSQNPRRRLRPLLWAVVLASLLLPSRPAFAGAWTRDQWHFYLQVGSGFSFADNAFGAAGNDIPIFVRTGKQLDAPNMSNFQQLLTDLYFEVGLLDRLTVFGNLGYSSMRQKNPGGDINYSTTAFNDMMLGLRFGIIKDPFALALETRITIPTGSTGSASSPIPSGTGDLRGELRLAAAKAFTFLPVYIDGEFGLTFRGHAEIFDFSSPTGSTLVQYSPELVFHLEVGAALVRWQYVTRLLLIGSLDYRTSTQQADPNSIGTDLLSLTPDTSEQTSVGVALMWYVYHGLGIQARYSQIVEGMRIPKISTVGGAIFLEY